MGRMSEPRPIATWLTDMDGVLVHEEDPIPGAKEFMEALKGTGLPFLVLTNNSIFTPRDLRARLLMSGIDVPEDAIWTSALATAQFLLDQRPGGSAYVVGEAGLTTALHDIGYVMTDRNPDYVVLGETRTYSFEAITRAIRLIEGGARFIATNPDVSGPSAAGLLPATGSVAALISAATGQKPYFIGKPNPLMMRSALNRLEAHSESTVMIGDRMDTDIISGLEAGIRTILVTTGSTRPEHVERFPYKPTRVVDSIADLVELVSERAPRGLAPEGLLQLGLAHLRPALDALALRLGVELVAGASAGPAWDRRPPRRPEEMSSVDVRLACSRLPGAGALLVHRAGGDLLRGVLAAAALLEALLHVLVLALPLLAPGALRHGPSPLLDFPHRRPRVDRCQPPVGV